MERTRTTEHTNPRSKQRSKEQSSSSQSRPNLRIKIPNIHNSSGNNKRKKKKKRENIRTGLYVQTLIPKSQIHKQGNDQRVPTFRPPSSPDPQIKGSHGRTSWKQKRRRLPLFLSPPRGNGSRPRRRANGVADLVRSEADLFSGVSGSGPDGDASRVTA